MLAVARKLYEDVVDLEQYADDGRLTEPSDGKRYDWRKMIDKAEKLGRPLNNIETERYIIK